MSHKAGSSTTEVRHWLDAAHRRLREHSDVLDDLNVFPVADADTGANLSATVGFAAEAAHLIEGKDVGELLTYAGQAALEQARGNSGVLAAVALTAMGGAVQGSVRLTAAQLKDAFTAAQVRCSSALTDPVPGTLISVLQAAGETPVPETAAEGSNQQLVDWLDLVLAACTRAVIDTVGQLPVLAEQGMDHFHLYSFATTRQAGLTAALAAHTCRYLAEGAERWPGDLSAEQLRAAAESLDAAATAAKTLQFQLARAARGRTPRVDASAEAFVTGYDTGMQCVRDAVGMGE